MRSRAAALPVALAVALGAQPATGEANRAEPPAERSAVARPSGTLSLSIDAVVGQNNQPAERTALWFGAPPMENLSFSTIVLGLRYRTAGGFGCGAVAPFAAGGASVWNRDAPEPFAALGNLAAFATWEGRLGPGTLLPGGLLLALPTSVWSVDASRRADHLTRTRAFTDDELMLSDRLSIVPSVGLRQELGPVDASVTAKLPIMMKVFPDDQANDVALDVVLEGRVKVRLMDGARTKLSAELRAIYGVFVLDWAKAGPHAPGQLAIDPGLMVHIGHLDLRAGVVIPIAVYDAWEHAFPNSFGLRVGAGYEL